MAGAPIELRGVKVDFRHGRAPVAALQEVDLRIAAGEFVAIVGPSGCGKSTILNLVAGLLLPSGGQLLVGGLPPKGTGPDRLVVFQEGALFPWLDVRGNVAFGLRRAAKPKAERERLIDEALATVQLTRFKDARIHELSGGMRQRVALARGLVMDPSVLLMDEPFAALDAQTREDLQQKIEELWLARKPTVLFITHDVEEAAFLADRIVVMSHRPGTVRAILDVAAKRPRERSDPAVEAAAAAARKVLQAEFAWQKQRELEGELVAGDSAMWSGRHG